MRINILVMTALGAALGLVLFLGGDAFAAKRLGDGLSFGSKPSFSKPFSSPMPSSPGLGRQGATPGAPTAAPMRPRGFNMFGGLLMGGLIGSMLFGGHFMGPNMLDFFFLAFLVWFILRLFNRRPPSRRDPRRGNADNEADPRQASEAYRRAQAAWDMLSQDQNPDQGQAQAPEGPTVSGAEQEAAAAVRVPEGFDTADFLKGAKMVYSRLQEAWADRDLEDARGFCSPEVFAEIKAQAEADPTPSPIEVLMVEARLLEVQEDGQDLVATVFYDALLREDRRKDRPDQVREVWHFRRDGSDPDSMWILEGIQQVQ